MAEKSDEEKKALILNSIRGVPDFPKQGILFWDVTTILLNPVAFQYTIDLFAKQVRQFGFPPSQQTYI
jgi:adenine phosphoribosyltransferase